MSGTIVVGIDGSPASEAGLRWATEEAAIRDARLVVLHAWSYVPPAPLAEPGLVPMPAIDYAATIEAEHNAVVQELDAVFAEVFPEGVPPHVERKLVEGDAGEALADASRDADLVVVGSRGRSGIAAALLGSVSRHVLDRATCPVVVVRAPDD